jgi:hypothetical protein
MVSGTDLPTGLFTAFSKCCDFRRVAADDQRTIACLTQGAPSDISKRTSLSRHFQGRADKAAGRAIEQHSPLAIGLIEDPVEDCSGPIWLRGGVVMTSADGHQYEKRYT